VLAGEREKAPAIVEAGQLIRQGQVPQFFLYCVQLKGLMRRTSKQFAHQSKEFPRRVRGRKDFRDFAQDSVHLPFVAGEHGGRESLANDFRRRARRLPESPDARRPVESSGVWAARPLVIGVEHIPQLS
jgi:hypothetical protein